MNTEIITENLDTKESKMQFILDEIGELQEIPKDKCKPVEYPIKYKLKNAFEVFVRVDGTENYWISNYGRCVNNYLSKKLSTKKWKRGKFHPMIVDNPPKKRQENTTAKKMTKWLDLRNLFFTAAQEKSHLPNKRLWCIIYLEVVGMKFPIALSTEYYP